MIKKENLVIFTLLACSVLYALITFLVFLTNGKVKALVKKKISIGTSLIALTAIFSGLYFNSSAATSETKVPPTETVPAPTPSIILCYTPPPYTISPTLPTSVQVDIDYIIQSNWKTGATIKIIITNTGTSSINAWELSFDFPDNQKITNLWGGSYNQIGSKVTIRNASWNSKILVNESVNIGFNLTHNGINEKPKNITID